MTKPTAGKVFVFSVLISIVAGCAKKQADYGYAPPFTLPDVNGNQISLSDFQDKVIIVTFWATWCTGCVAEIPHFIELYDQYKDQGLGIIAISLDEGGADDVRPFLKKKPINYTMLIGNEDVSKQYNTKGILPTTFVIDRTGKIRSKYVGYRKKPVFEKDIKMLLNAGLNR
ncbi:MAG TPA: TlpA disulfide reductase family protein [Sedimentisphaerales bacterium]|nr:TlpA disulfide reductase family protein [Sedimentisphaerales bacterium]